jgi:acyl-CoA thioesterase I
VLPPRRPSRALRAALPLAVLVAAAPVRAATALVYVALGDSTATGVGADGGGGYPTRLARRLEVENGFNVKLVNLGVPGATAADLRREQLPRGMGSGPQLVTIAIGLNDLVQGRTLAEFSRDLQVIADSVHRTKAAVVISTLPDLSLSPSAQGSPASVSRRIQQYNAAIQTVAERYGFQVADLWTASRAASRAEGPAIWAADGFHPSALGYERWAEAMWPAAERALGPKVQARRAGAGTAAGR